MNKTSLTALLLLLSALALAQPSPQELDASLAGTVGRERLEILVTLTTTHRVDNAARAVESGREALELLRSHPDRARQLEVLNSLAYAHMIQGEYGSALRVGSQARELAGEMNDRSALAFAFRNLGRVHRSSSDYESALLAYAQAAELYGEVGEKPELGDALNDTGVVYWMRGDYPTALEYFIQAREQYEAAGDRQRIAAILNNTGMVHRRLKQHSRALKFYHEALGIRRQVGPDGAISNVLNNIGNVHRDLGEPAQALEYFLESLGISKDKYGHANTLINVGSAYQALGALDRAMGYYQQANDVKEALGDKHGVAQALLRIGSVQRQRRDLESALESLRQALAINEELDTKDEIKDVQLELSETYAEMGRYREAFEAFQQYEEVKSEIFNQQNSKNIAEMEARFESDRKEKEIEILKQQQAIDGLELKRQTIARRALYGGLALLSLVVGLLYNRYRLKARSSRLTERQNAELEAALAELKESEGRYHRLFDDPSTAKLLVDPSAGTILDANGPGLTLVNGQSLTELAGREISELGCAWLSRLASRVSAAGEPASCVETFQQSIEGEVRDFEAWVSELRLSGRRVVLLTLHDVTERRRLEEERVRQEERERYVAELEARKAEVEMRNAEMERFTYTVSHDLKSPLVTIRGFLGLVEQDALAGNTNRMKRDLSRIHAASERMVRLLDELLQLSRIGRVANEPQEVVLAELVGEAVEQLSAQFAKRGVDVVVTPDLPTVFGDRVRLSEVLQNLLENALKFFGDQPRPRVEIGSRQDGHKMVIVVRDNGIGIEPPYHQQIFGLFDRLDVNTPGTGVGLALVKRIVEVHGGRIWVESEGQGRGAAFCFTLGTHTDSLGPPKTAGDTAGREAMI